MAHLIKIGNSQGIRIPQALIKQADLQDKEIEIHVVENGLLVAPVIKPRRGWEEQFKRLSQSEMKNESDELGETLDHSAELPTGEAWEW